MAWSTFALRDDTGDHIIVVRPFSLRATGHAADNGHTQEASEVGAPWDTRIETTQN